MIQVLHHDRRGGEPQFLPRDAAVRRARTSQHKTAAVESDTGTQWWSKADADAAHMNARRFATTSYTGATKLRLRTWDTAMTTPHANVTDSSALTMASVWRLVPRSRVGIRGRYRPGVIIDEIRIADSHGAWRALGFTVNGDVCQVGSVRFRFGGEGAGITGWTLVDADARSGAPTHPNHVTKIDHVVLMSPDLARTAKELRDAYGLEVLRERDAGAFKQLFLRLGEAVLEVIGPHEPGPGEDNFWGITFRVDDIDALAAHLGERVGRIKDAVQPGRQITTLRGQDIGISPAIAFISPRLASA